MLTGSLNLVDNGHVAFVENLGANELGANEFRFYRFGIHSGGSDIQLDGLHMANENTSDEIRLVLAPNDTKAHVTGNLTATTLKPLVSFETSEENVALNVVGKVVIKLR